MATIEKIAPGNKGPLRMSPTWGGSAKDENESIATIQSARDNGIYFLNTNDFYGSGHKELLVAKAIKGRRNNAFLSVKFGAIIYGSKVRRHSRQYLPATIGVFTYQPLFISF